MIDKNLDFDCIQVIRYVLFEMLVENRDELIQLQTELLAAREKIHSQEDTLFKLRVRYPLFLFQFSGTCMVQPCVTSDHLRISATFCECLFIGKLVVITTV